MVEKENCKGEYVPSRGRFHVMIKPGGSECNLNCTYCFYLNKNLLIPAPMKRMPDEVLERLIEQYISGTDHNEVVFSWQGGEPTLPGVGFYQKVVELQKKHARPGQLIQNDLQTNGTLIDENWCRFLRDNRFLVGLSIDGPRELHDRFRIDKGGQPTFERVFAAAKMLRQYGVTFNTLTVVNRVNARHPREVYNFLRNELGSEYIQLLPCVNYRSFLTTAPGFWDIDKLPMPDSPRARPDAADSIVTDWSVDAEDYGDFLCAIFDDWYSRDLGKVLVNQFETLVSQHMGFGAQMCVYNDFCGKAVAVECDGAVYSCDHMVYPEYCLGNIAKCGLPRMVLGPEQRRFGYAKRESLPACCRQCPYLKDCWGECPKNRCLKSPDGEPGLNYLCRGLKKFYAHAVPLVESIVADLRKVRVNRQARLPGR